MTDRNRAPWCLCMNPLLPALKRTVCASKGIMLFSLKSPRHLTYPAQLPGKSSHTGHQRPLTSSPQISPSCFPPVVLSPPISQSGENGSSYLVTSLLQRLRKKSRTSIDFSSLCQCYRENCSTLFIRGTNMLQFIYILCRGCVCSVHTVLNRIKQKTGFCPPDMYQSVCTCVHRVACVAVWQ